MEPFAIARDLLREFKGDAYLFGNHVLKDVGRMVASAGKRAVLIRGGFPGVEDHLNTIRNSISRAGVGLVAEIQGARPNAPREDLQRITDELKRANPDVIISFAAGSTIDAAKAAEVLRTLGGQIDDYFGTGLVTKKLQVRSVPVRASGETPHGVTTNKLTPHIAIQTAASSAAHLTKYSNITDLTTGQKKLIVDDAIVPSHPVFDFAVTHTAPPALTADGALDGLSHILEVFYGAVGKPYYDRLSQIAQLGISLIVNYLPKALKMADSTRGNSPQSALPRCDHNNAENPHMSLRGTQRRSNLNPEDGRLLRSARNDMTRDPQLTEAREALCLATDLGGYAIMLGGTSGGHLTSFSLVDILSHGRACALMNPYYTVFFAPAVEHPLRVIGQIFQDAGYISRDLAILHGHELGVAVANGMFAFARAIDFPTTLGEVPGFTRAHIDRALTAAKNPQLKMKLENMPIPLTAEMIDEYMAPILEAAVTGDLALIKDAR